MNGFLPVSQSDLNRRGWDRLDVILITGDAYVDHPAYGTALIGRALEARGLRVGVIAQPDWRSPEDFKRLGQPRLFFGITSGNVDSMVANYTANKRLRKKDDYSPGGKAGLRPDRALIVYANRVRQVFKDAVVVVGGMEASMRRLAHYDYWDNRVRRSILFDARADMLVYGMGERQILEIARRLQAGEAIDAIDGIRGTAVIRKDPSFSDDPVRLPSCEAAAADPEKFNQAFRLYYRQQNPYTARAVIQAHGDRYAVIYPPPLPLPVQQLDALYELHFTRRWHPRYDAAGGVPGLETVRHSLITHRGCCGECNFCSLYFHQGRMVQSRSADSVVREAERLAQDPSFRGTITDMGGPTANLYGADCPRWAKKGFCKNKRCLSPKACDSLDPGYDRGLPLYRRIRKIPGVKHAFIGSGFRHDLFEKKGAAACLEELCRHHISGRMKVAPEHVCNPVLDAMGKPPIEAYDAFVERFERVGKKLSARRFLVNYFISAHPGATLRDALEMARYLIRRGLHPEQVQDFIPLPGTFSGVMYHTERHPFTGKRIYVAKTFRERKMQRALIQYRNPGSRKWIREALKILNARHLEMFFFRHPNRREKSHLSGKGRVKPARTRSPSKRSKRANRSRVKKRASGFRARRRS
jgi:uncharacterized radical SAM protein YgiQ